MYCLEIMCKEHGSRSQLTLKAGTKQINNIGTSKIFSFYLRHDKTNYCLLFLLFVAIVLCLMKA
jgi:hypothetical protein